VPIELIPNAPREIETRLGGIYDEFTTSRAQDDDFRHPLAASLAAAIFTQHREAREVEMRVQEYLPYTMDEYRQGKRADWSDYYTAHLSRGEKR
jgi:hypothetical protein